MLFVFKTLNFLALGAILLTPFWFFNNTLDQMLPHAPAAHLLSPHFDTSTAQLRERIVSGLGNLKRDIRADICRRGAKASCLQE